MEKVKNLPEEGHDEPFIVLQAVLVLGLQLANERLSTVIHVH
jgi:hypothetical protein